MSSVTILLDQPSGPLYGDIIGVEQGAVYCVLNKINMKLACGDFDSVSKEEIESIKTLSNTFVQLNPIKDLTDFEAALEYCKGYDSIYVYGALGRRLDHEMVNLFLAYKDTRIILLDESNRIQSFSKGDYTFKKGEYTYFSIIPFNDTIITLEGFKYPLFKRKVNAFDTYLSSNEIIDEGTLSIYNGSVLVVQSND